MKRILVTGANSYIGENVRNYLLKEQGDFVVEVKDTFGWEPKPEDFSTYDAVFNVAGIAHIKETKDNRNLYYDVNRDLVVKIAKAAKKGGVKQFILLSTMSVYGKTTGYITKNTAPCPVNAYGKSKLQADIEIEKIASDNFIFTCLRPPMVYGKDCRGNYQKLRMVALKSAIFPEYSNKRSMIYIGNLCEFVKKCIEEEKGGVFFPQNEDYVVTSNMVMHIAKCHNKRIFFTKLFNPAIKLIPADVIKKVFGDLTYEQVDTVNKYPFKESMIATEA